MNERSAEKTVRHALQCVSGVCGGVLYSFREKIKPIGCEASPAPAGESALFCSLMVQSSAAQRDADLTTQGSREKKWLTFANCDPKKAHIFCLRKQHWKPPSAAVYQSDAALL